MRPLQERLAAAGLSSLGRMESHVLAHLNAIIDLLRCALSKNSADKIILPIPEATGAAQLESNTNNLFGKPPRIAASASWLRYPVKWQTIIH